MRIVSTALFVAALCALVALPACGGDDTDGNKEPGEDTTQEEVAEEVAEQCPEGEACDDGDPCTKDDTCQAGSCAGVTYTCDDGVACTDDSCTGDGACLHTPAEGTACVFQGDCYPEGPLDDNPCLVCDPTVIVDGLVPLADGSPCPDDDPCTIDETCVDGVCEMTTSPCDDDNPCTYDTCDSSGGCIYEYVSISCDDGDPCTGGDFCKEGACVPGDELLACDDEDPCTLDTCEPFVGCTFEQDPAICDDGNPCTEDICKAGAGCSYSNLTGDCDDGDNCTIGDTCVDGTCVAGSEVLVCGDDNPCTTDSCSPEGGCVYQFNEEPCDDGLACTTTDVCTYGECFGKLDSYADWEDVCACSYPDFSDIVQKATVLQMGDSGYPGEGLDVDGDPLTCAPAGMCSDGIDNALGVLAFFLNDAFQEAIDMGSFTFVAEFVDFKDDGSPFTLNFLYGDLDDEINPFCDSQTEACVYEVFSWNYLADCSPRVSVDNVTYDNGNLTGGGEGYVFFLNMPLTTGTSVEFYILDGVIDGTVSTDADGNILSMEGLIAGAIPKANIIETIEAIDDSYFPLPKDTIIETIEMSVINDVDLDGDGVFEAASVGIRYSTIVGFISKGT